MINIKELRIGNWVEHNDEWCYRGEDVYQFQWDDSDWYALGESTMFIQNINPIPLTEQWLIDFGFGKVQNIYQRHNQILLDPESNGSYKVKFWTHSISRAEPLYQSNLAIRYVHQLQNLYFALTGEELTKK